MKVKPTQARREARGNGRNTQGNRTSPRGSRRPAKTGSVALLDEIILTQLREAGVRGMDEHELADACARTASREDVAFAIDVRLQGRGLVERFEGRYRMLNVTADLVVIAHELFGDDLAAWQKNPAEVPPPVWTSCLRRAERLLGKRRY